MKKLLLILLITLSSCYQNGSDRTNLICTFDTMIFPGIYSFDLSKRTAKYFSFIEERWKDSVDELSFSLNSIIISRKQLVGNDMEDTQFIVNRKTMAGQFVNSTRDFDCKVIDNRYMQDQISLYLARLSQDRVF